MQSRRDESQQDTKQKQAARSRAGEFASRRQQRKAEARVWRRVLGGPKFYPVIQRAGVIGDIHAEDDALEVVLAFMAKQNLDGCFAVGDIVDGPGSVDRCCQLLRDYDVVTVAGNHERWFLAGAMRDVPMATNAERMFDETRQFLEGLPGMVEIETAAGLALLCHGLGPNDMAGVQPHDDTIALQYNRELQGLLAERAYRFVMNGHTHMRMVRRVDGLTILNGGTLFREHDPGFLLVDFQAGHVESFELLAPTEIRRAWSTEL